LVVLFHSVILFLYFKAYRVNLSFLPSLTYSILKVI
jgi:hypothetical protein